MNNPINLINPSIMNYIPKINLSICILAFGAVLMQSCKSENDVKIFSDNLQQFVYVTEISPHIYKIPGKNESYNTYSYHNGVCTSIILNSKLLTLVLKRK